MKRTEESNVKNLSKLGKMFVYIALKQIKAKVEGHDSNSCVVTEQSLRILAEKLEDLGVVDTSIEWYDDEDKGTKSNVMLYISINEKGAPLVARYFAACADELRSGHFGKLKWDRRSKMHKAIMARIA